jgi:predicted O-linked N-acetylglucosamine transferase (SPINDLY family)
MPTLAETIAVAMNEAQRGRLPAAVDSLRRQLPLHPSSAELQHALGILLMSTGAAEQAEFHLDRAVNLGPRRPEHHSNHGIALGMLGRHRESAKAFQKSLQVNPSFFPGHVGLSSALLSTGDYPGAAAAAQRAAEVAPQRAEPWLNLAAAHERCGRTGEAVAALHQGLAHVHDHPLMLMNLCAMLAYRPEADPQQVFEEHQRLGRVVSAITPPAMYPDFGAPDPSRTLRLGFLSPDVRDEASACLLAPLARHLPAAGFETYGYTASLMPEPLVARARALFGVHRDASGLTEAQLEQRIRADKIDILIDCAGHAPGGRVALMTRRLAPVQGAWLGYPGTTGIREVDVRFVDSVLAPEGAERRSTEKLVRLDPCAFCYEPPADAPAPGPLPADASGSVTLGSFDSAGKVSEPCLAAWAAVLKAAPGARLVLASNAYAAPACRDDFLSRFAAQGIGAERIQLRPAVELGALPRALAELDISLDTFPFGGGAVTAHAVHMGVPVITLRGGSQPGRTGASLLGAAGLPELVAGDEADYVAKAAGLARDLPRLRAYRSSLRETLRGSALCDGAAFGGRFGSACRDLWTAWCAKQA